MTIDVPGLVLANGGELVGSVRLQKVVYLLDQIGLSSGFTFDYRHYGPYSRDLADQVDDDIVFGHLKAETRRRKRDGVPYVVYSANKAGESEPVDRHLAPERLKEALREMQGRTAIVLELAATMHWLVVAERRDDWRAELERRKGVKTHDGRDTQALELLRTLGLPPGISAPAP